MIWSRLLCPVVVVSCSSATLGRAAPQSVPAELHDWKLEYTVKGGIAPYLHSVTLTSVGELVGTDSRLGHRVSTHAPHVINAANAFLKHARSARAAGPPGPDMPVTDLIVTAGGHAYSLEPTPDIRTILDDAFYAAVSRGLIGDWWESEWKLCKPVAQLGPSDIDLPIDALIFKDDGTFSVTWRRDARTTGVQHGPVPDYHGRYTVEPAMGAIHMRIDGGVFVPEDFSGKGAFSLADGKLIIRTAWFGTRQAKQKPDICELTFTKR